MSNLQMELAFAAERSRLQGVPLIARGVLQRIEEANGRALISLTKGTLDYRDRGIVRIEAGIPVKVKRHPNTGRLVFMKVRYRDGSCIDYSWSKKTGSRYQMGNKL